MWRLRSAQCLNMQGMTRPKTDLLQHSLRRQRGMTALGLTILLAFMGIFAFGAIRLTPVYLNYMKVIGVVDGVVAEFEGQRTLRRYGAQSRVASMSKASVKFAQKT